MKFKIIHIIFILVLIGCKKSNERKCIKSNGPISDREIQLLKTFDRISLYDDLNLILIADSLNYLTVQGPKNLIGLVEIDSSSNELILSNLNKCNFLRKRKDIDIHFHYSTLKEIDLHGHGSVRNSDEIKHNLTIFCNNAFSTVNLTLNNSNTSIYKSQGSTEIILKGTCSSLYCYNSGLAPIKAKHLETQKTHVNSNTISFFEVNVLDSLIVELNNSGNVYYLGNPSYTNFTIHGDGQIINIQ